MNPRVSVVMPAYQAAWSVGAAVESVLWQTYRDLEVVVVDDGSTDATAEIVRAHEGPVRVVHQENAGVAAARNRGIAEAAGELIAFCDSDDLWFPAHLEALVEVYDRAGGGIATANSYWLFPGGIHPARTRFRGRFPTADEQRRAILEQNFVSTMALFPRRLPEEIGPFPVDRRRAEDWDFWIRAIYAGHRVAFVGDGVNDAPALTAADLGMAIGTGSDVAVEAGQVVLMSGNPELAEVALGLATATFRVIRENLFWAFAYNTAAIPLAALGFLDPMIAAAAMALSSVSVVGNSLRLRRYRAAT